MSKERRLGRGLEALLGGLPGWGGSTPQSHESLENNPLAAMPDMATPDIQPPRAAGPAALDPVSRMEEVLGQPATPRQPIALAEPVAEKPAAEPAAPAANPPRLEIDLIASNPTQPRQDFNAEELNALAESIAAHGLLQPVVVRRVKDRYELIAGERRLQAAKRAGWSSVPVNVIEADDRQTAELAIIENLHRKDLNALEKAASFQRYLEQYGCTQEELAGRLTLNRSTIANLIRLLELPAAVQEAIRQGKITQGHARAILPLGDEREQVAFCERVQKEGLSVRQTESLVQAAVEQADRATLGVVGRDGKTSRAKKGRNAHIASLEQELRAALGARVKLSHDARGRGQLVIHFDSHEEFERIRQQLCQPAGPTVQTQAG